MAQQDRIEDFIRGLFAGRGGRISKQEILAAAEREVKPTEGYRDVFEKIPDHDYDQPELTNAVASILVRR